MADQQAKLNPQQQAALSKIMATTTSQPAAQNQAPATYQVAEVGTSVSEVPESKTKNKNDDEEKSGGSNNIGLTIIFIVGGLVLLGGYAFFWLKYFKIF
jgi:hypothetical protein